MENRLKTYQPNVLLAVVSAAIIVTFSDVIWWQVKNWF